MLSGAADAMPSTGRPKLRPPAATVKQMLWNADARFPILVFRVARAGRLVRANTWTRTRDA